MDTNGSLSNGSKKSMEREGEKLKDEFPFGKSPFVFEEMPFNPFTNDSVSISEPFEILKTIIIFPIFLIRVLILLLMFPLGYLFAKFAMIGAKNVLTKPFPRWRRNVMWPVTLCARGILFACGFNWIKVKGKPAPREIAPILVSNHCTFIDPVFFFYAHLPMFVIAKENFNIPLAGAIMRAIQAIPVDRSSPTSRRDAGGEIKRRSICNDWRQVALFPEATTTNGKALVSFKTGAFLPGLPIQPCIVRYPHVRVDPSWVVEGPAVHILLFRLMTQFHNHMEVEYLDVIEPSVKEIKDPRLYTERCRMEMARALNVTVTEHGFGDVALAIEALKLQAKSPKGFACIEFGRFERLFKLDLKEGKALLRKFKKMDISGKGYIAIQGFLEVLNLPETPVTQKVFNLFDTSDRGHINFREYVAGCAFITKHSKFQNAVHTVFNVGFGADILMSEEGKKGLKSLLPFLSEEQVTNIFESMEKNKDGTISLNEFESFLQRNPEYLASILMANPEIVSKV